MAKLLQESKFFTVDLKKGPPESDPPKGSDCPPPVHAHEYLSNISGRLDLLPVTALVGLLQLNI